MSITSYLESTEPAVQHMFLALDFYARLTPHPSLEQYRDQRGVITLNRDEAIDYLHGVSDSMSLDFAEATLCGSIIQVAYSGISQYSNNEDIPESCKALGITKESKWRKFCIGRNVHELPIGLFIYAARIQYNHWEDGYPTSPIAQKVFHHLTVVRYEDPLFDLAYEMDWPVPRPITHHVVQLELKWRGYNDYLKDMNDMLGEVP